MRKKITRYLAAALAAVTVLTPALSSCGKVKMPEKQTVDHVYRTTEIPMPEGLNYVNYMTVCGDKIRLTGDVYDEETYVHTTRIYEMNLDGTGLTDITPSAPEGEQQDENSSFYMVVNTIAPDGSMWEVQNYYSYDPDTSVYTDGYRFIHTGADGSEIAVFDGTDLWGEVPEGEYRGIVGLAVASDGSLALLSDSTVYLTDENMTDIREIDISTYMDTGYIQNLLPAGDTVYLFHYDWSGTKAKQTLIPLSVKTGALGEGIVLDTDALGDIYSVFPGEGYTFYYMNETAVYGYDVETGKAEELLNFVNSDLNYSIAYNLTVISPDKFVAMGYDSMTSTRGIFLFDRVPDEEVVPKYILTIGVLEDDWSILSDVIRFNRQSSEYRIQIKTYELNYDGEGEYDYDALMEEAVTALGNDILTGNGPDILVTSPYLPMESYVAKKLFVNLYDYIDSDERFSRDDFLPNILSAMEIRGGLYEIAPTFYLDTLIGKTSLVGDRDRWTMEEFSAFVNALPDTTMPFFEATREQMMDLFLSAMYTEFVSTDTGTCSFDSAAFRALLTYLLSVPEELDEDRYNDQDYWNRYDNRFREDFAALERAQVTTFNSLLQYMSYPFYTSELSMVGIPTSGESGAVISAGQAGFAISAKSPLKDGAWEFVSRFLTKEYQDGITYYFPLRADSLDTMMENALAEAEENRKYYEEHKDEYGYYDGGYAVMPGLGVAVTTSTETVAVPEDEEEAVDEGTVVADTDAPAVSDAEAGDAEDTAEAVDTDVPADTADDIITQPAVPGYTAEERRFLTREDAERILAYIKSANRMARKNASVTNIIKDDAAAFFAGKKSLEETVKLIQNRVSTFVAESQ